MTRGRPTSTRVPTFYDYRRPILLVQILALPPEQRSHAIIYVGKAWGLFTEDMDFTAMTSKHAISRLAQHALAHAAAERKSAENESQR